MNGPLLVSATHHISNQSAVAMIPHAMLLVKRCCGADRPPSHLVVVAQLLARRDCALGEDADVVGAVHLGGRKASIAAS